MSKKRKIVIISISIIIALVLLSVAVFFITRNVTEVANENRLSKMYDKMMKDETYQITFKLNEDNQYTVSRSGDVANIDTYNDGKHLTNIVKDGNTYLLMYQTKKYYMYQNNTTGLGELSNELNRVIQSQEPEKGEEKIDGKTYKYEEYKGVSYFLMNEEDSVIEENTNTRFYFEGDDLQYIKTITGDKSELIQVDVSYHIDNQIFEIPSDFQEG